jgi:hypothetical protein
MRFSVRRKRVKKKIHDPCHNRWDTSNEVVSRNERRPAGNSSGPTTTGECRRGGQMIREDNSCNEGNAMTTEHNLTAADQNELLAVGGGENIISAAASAVIQKFTDIMDHAVATLKDPATWAGQTVYYPQ